MFENLSERLGASLKRLRGSGRLTEKNIQDALREVRMALLEADVALPVVRDFIEQVRERALGRDVMQSLSPGEELIRVVRDELTHLMGDVGGELDLKVTPPAVFLMAGLQGSGKTTTVAKLARWLKEKQKKNVLVASCDVYRPAAMEQLETLANEVGARCYRGEGGATPVAIATAAVDTARKRACDVVIIDTAGRLHVDEAMMGEIKALHEAVNPVETLFVADSMAGQDAANVARAFGEALPLTGVILSKADGDARGGAALSIRQITGKPIKFLGVGEKTEALEVFHPERVASRILGMGDVLGFIEEAEQKLDRKHAQKLAQKIKKGKGFDLEDYRDQLRQVRSMGGVSSLLEKLPGGGKLPGAAQEQAGERELIRSEAIINSMTPLERRRPAIIKGSRKRRIAAGSGTQVQDVNRLLKQMTQMQKMMKRMKKRGGMGQLLAGLKGGGRPGMPF